MELVLWRHADAEDGLVDLDRRLTEKGRHQARRMAAWLRPRLEGKWDILTSPAARAQETAQALELKAEVRLTLGIGATEDAVLREARWPEGGRNVLVVGHQPTLGRIASRLLTGHRGDLSVKKGAAWWFSSRIDGGHGPHEVILRAVIAPDLAQP